LHDKRCGMRGCGRGRPPQKTDRFDIETANLPTALEHFSEKVGTGFP
jgi:hypothetical protein